MLKPSIAAVAEFMSGHGTTLLLIGAIITGGIIGTVFPQASAVAASQIDMTILVLIGLLLFEIRFTKLLSSLQSPTVLVAAIVANFAIIPFLGYAVASFFLPDHPLLAVGLTIYFLAPCTDWFLGFTRLAKGNTALGAALIPINLVLQMLLFPAYLHIFGITTQLDMNIDIAQTLIQWFVLPLAIITVLRFAAARLLRPTYASHLEQAISIAIPVCLALLVWQICAANIATLALHANNIPAILMAIFVFFSLTFLMSEAISKVLRLTYEDHVILTMTTSARNAPLMLALTLAVLPDQPLIVAAIVLGMVVELPHLIALKTLLLKRQASRTLPSKGTRLFSQRSG
ncbi:MAG: arsenic resistance protein [Pseudomonadota bacterium]